MQAQCLLRDIQQCGQIAPQEVGVGRVKKNGSTLLLMYV